MSHHGYPRTLLNRTYERIAPPWNDQIDVPVLIEQCRHLRARLDGLYECSGQRSAPQSSLNRTRQLGGSPRRFFAAFEYRSITLK